MAENLVTLETLRSRLPRHARLMGLDLGTKTIGLALSDVAFAARLTDSPQLQEAIRLWLEGEARRPAEVSPGDWLRFEQEKHQRLLTAA